MKEKRLALTISVLLVVCILTGCNRVIQPSRADFVRASSFIKDQPVNISVTMLRSASDINIGYTSQIAAEGDFAQWDGKAVVDYYGTLFVQKCKTICSKEKGYKEWRGQWVTSETRSPVPMIMDWLQAVSDGVGIYEKEPEVPADTIAEFEDLTEPTYLIQLSSQQAEWNRMWDAHLDSLFGGNEMMTIHERWYVWLYFGAEDHQLKAAIISSGGVEDMVNIFMQINPADEHLDTTLPHENIGEGHLAEEWEIQDSE